MQSNLAQPQTPEVSELQAQATQEAGAGAQSRAQEHDLRGLREGERRRLLLAGKATRVGVQGFVARQVRSGSRSRNRQGQGVTLSVSQQAIALSVYARIYRGGA